MPQNRFLRRVWHVLLLWGIATICVIALAWGAAVRPRVQTLPTGECDSSQWGDQWATQDIAIFKGWGWATVNSFASRYHMHMSRMDLPEVALPAWSFPAQSEPLPEKIEVHIDDSVFGWPFLCLQSRQIIESTQTPPDIRFGIDCSAIARRLNYVPHSTLLPTHVLWPQFLTNTAFNFIALIVLVSIGGVARRTIRTRRGRCQSCNYDLKGLPENAKCPECGHSRLLATG